MLNMYGDNTLAGAALSRPLFAIFRFRSRECSREFLSSARMCVCNVCVRVYHRIKSISCFFFDRFSQIQARLKYSDSSNNEDVESIEIISHNV